MTRLSTVAGLVFFLSLTGCPGESSSSGSSTQKPPPFANETAILQANVAEPSVAQTLESVALDRAYSPSMRYAALRRLEESRSPRAVGVAEALVSDPSRTKDAEFLRKNGVRLLAQNKTAAGQAALARVTSSSVEVATLAARLKGEK